MKLIKRITILALSILFLVSLSACKNFSMKNEGKDYLKIYDAQNKLIENVEGKNSTKMLLDSSEVKKEGIPKDAKVSYKYVLHERKHNIKSTIIVYSNYKLAKVSGIPVIGGGTIHLNDKEFNKLNHPSKIVNND